MVNLINSNRIIFLLLLAPLVLSGCQFSVDLKSLDEKLGEVLEALQNGEARNTASSTEESLDYENIDPKNLTKEQKEKIDGWLEGNGFNRYGDEEGIYYTGGTPLFDESTGESIERFEYIFEKHPDILEKLQN